MENRPTIKLAGPETEKRKIEKMAASSVAQERQFAWLRKLLSPFLTQQKNEKELAVIYYDKYPNTMPKGQQN